MTSNTVKKKGHGKEVDLVASTKRDKTGVGNDLYTASTCNFRGIFFKRRAASNSLFSKSNLTYQGKKTLE